MSNLWNDTQEELAPPLTPGQARIRAIVARSLPAYQAAATYDEREAIWRTAHQQMADDPVINRDHITGKSLDVTGIAESYLDWLDEQGPVVRQTDGTLNVRLDRFIYQYGGRDMRHGAAWTGGAKPDSTLSCLFGLAEHRTLHVHGLTARYYTRSGILTIAGGGNHRLLAHVLWGEPTITPDWVYVHHERYIDEDLNAALYQIERWFQPTPYRFEFASYNDATEVWSIKTFLALTTPDERAVLTQYLAHLAQRPVWWGEDFRKHAFTIHWLMTLVQELRRMQGYSPLRLKFALWLRDQRTGEGESPFEYWYLKYYLPHQARDRVTVA